MSDQFYNNEAAIGSPNDPPAGNTALSWSQISLLKALVDAGGGGSSGGTVKYAVIDVAASGDNTLVTAVTARKIRVLSLFVVAAGAVTARFESGASGTALTGQMNLPINGGFVLPYNPNGWFETALGALLNLELGGAISVDGSLSYVEVA